MKTRFGKGMTMKRLILTIILLLMPAWACGATYYVRTDGNDANNGSADDAAHAWLTIGKAWLSSNAASNNAIYIAAGNYYAETKRTDGGPNAGITWTFQFAAGQTNVRASAAATTYIFRPTAGRTGTTIFQGGSTGATKTTKWDMGTFGDDAQYTNVAGSFIYTLVANTFIINDIEIDGDAAAANSCSLGNGANGVNITWNRCYIHGIKRVTSGSGTNTLITNCYFYENQVLVFNFGTDAYSFTAYNNTFYQPTTNVAAFSSVGSKSGPIIIKNNLYLSDIAGATQSPFISVTSGHVLDSLTVSNNIAYKTTVAEPRVANNYPLINDLNSTQINNVISVNPDWTGSATSPSVASTSLTIGRGADVGITTDFASVAYPSNSIGCYAVVGGTKQYLTKSNKTILVIGDSWVYENLAASHGKFAGSLACMGSSACSPAWDTDFTGFTFVKMPGATDTLPGISGALFNAYRGMATELTQLNSPSVIIFDGGINDAVAATPWTGALIGSMHNSLADDLNDLYAGGDKPIIISVGLGAEDGNTPTTAIADAAEAVIGPYFETQGYRSVLFTKHAKKCAGGVADLYTAGEDVHPDATGWAFLAELVKAAILSEQYITDDSITKSYQPIKDTSNAAFGYLYGLTVAGDSVTLYNLSVSGFANDGILVQGDSPTVKNCVVSGSGTASGTNFAQRLTGATLATAGDFDYNNFRGEYYINGVDTADEAHDITGDPLFISATDLHLQSTSPCINAGTNVGLTSDYEGNPVPKGSAPDIGAYEYQSQVPDRLKGKRKYRRRGDLEWRYFQDQLKQLVVFEDREEIMNDGGTIWPF